MNPDQTPTPDTDAEFSRIVQNELLETSQGGEYDALRALRRFARTLEHQRNTARAEAKTHKQIIDAVIMASKWDGCDGLAQFIEQIRIEKDEAQQWIDSEPDWKDKYNAQMAAVVAERDSLRAEVARLTKERDEFQAELQKICDHDWQHIDDSFDHEFGTEQVHSCLCEKCGATKPYEPETFGDEAI